MPKSFMIALLLAYIASTLFVTWQLADKIPELIVKRLGELKLKLLDNAYTPRDLAFHRFARPDYLKELKKINEEKNDMELDSLMVKRRNLIVYLVVTSVVVAAFVFFYFLSIKK